MSVFRDIWAQTAPRDRLTRAEMLAKVRAGARIPEHDHAAADAALIGLLQGRFFLAEDGDEGWRYRKSETPPEEPKSPADAGPGSESFNAQLLEAHEVEQARLDREMAAYTAAHPNVERELLVRLIRATVDERLKELGIDTTAIELETA